MIDYAEGDRGTRTVQDEIKLLKQLNKSLRLDLSKAEKQISSLKSQLKASQYGERTFRRMAEEKSLFARIVQNITKRCT